jgi:hypothetical protein
MRIFRKLVMLGPVAMSAVSAIAASDAYAQSCGAPCNPTTLTRVYPSGVSGANGVRSIKISLMTDQIYGFRHTTSPSVYLDLVKSGQTYTGTVSAQVCKSAVGDTSWTCDTATAVSSNTLATGQTEWSLTASGLQGGAWDYYEVQAFVNTSDVWLQGVGTYLPGQ